jgi:hypothetical protein
VPVDVALGVAKAARGRAGSLGPGVAVPLRDPENTLREIRIVADRVVPGAVLRRHLFFRYSLTWTRPAV